MRLSSEIAIIFGLAICVLLTLFLPAGAAMNCPSYETARYELHYGFVEELEHAGSEEPITIQAILTPFYDGIQCAEPFCSTVHLTSELLWETGDRDSSLSPDFCMSDSGSYHSGISWESRAGSVGDPWDGLSFSWGYPSTDLDGAKLRIEIKVLHYGVEIYRFDKTFTARELKKRYPQIRSVSAPKRPHKVTLTPEGHALEMGAMFTLVYRVYDFRLIWGYGDFRHEETDHTHTCQDPSWPVVSSPLRNWDGRLGLTNGLIHYVQGSYLNDIEDKVTDCKGGTLSPGTLVPELCFESFVDEKVVGNFQFEDAHYVDNGNAKAIAMNLVAPSTAFYPANNPPIFSVNVAAEGQTLIDSTLPADQYRDGLTGESLGGYYELPVKWESLDAVFRCADTKHFAHGHEHWCWFKREY